MTKTASRKSLLRVQLSSGQLRMVHGGGDRDDAELPVLDATQEVLTPRDPASGLPTGKRMHKPFVW
jgi:hypothetical protein